MFVGRWSLVQYVLNVSSCERGGPRVQHNSCEPAAHGRLPVHRLQRGAALRQQADHADSAL